VRAGDYYTSQYGTVSVANVPVVSVDGAPSKAPEPHVAPVPARPPNRTMPKLPKNPTFFVKIERLADLQQKGILSVEEFAANKAELLSRL